MKKILSLIALLITSSVFAETPESILEHTIGSISVVEVTNTGAPFIPQMPAPPTIPSDPDSGIPTPINPPMNPRPGGGPGNGPGRSTLDNTRQVISTARDFVALGEAIYNLVQKGKPSNVTQYEAISVVPKDPMTGEYVDPFDMEGFGMPEERNFSASIKNGTGKEVVRFDYTLVYSYGGSYNGSGYYLTNVMIIPKSIKTTHGWDFNATMSLSGIMNHGSRANPVAGAMVTIKYQMNSWRAAFERNDTIHVTGKGQVRSYGIK
ncbi:MAG TPA: hypothetical protein VKZ84_01730 [Bacteriovoracaceae bacterium]|nr:hypothetical protein [Bacteriovoracaceae bacterium]